MFAALAQDQAAGSNRMTSAVDDGQPSSGLDEHPLIRAAMAVVGPAFGMARADGHRRRLGAAVADDHFEAVPESQPGFLHRTLTVSRTRGSTCPEAASHRRPARDRRRASR